MRGNCGGGCSSGGSCSSYCHNCDGVEVVAEVVVGIRYNNKLS